MIGPTIGDWSNHPFSRIGRRQAEGVASPRNADSETVYTCLVSAPIHDLERLAEFAESAPATDRKRMLLIINPYATSMTPHIRTLVLYALQARYEVDAVDTQARGHATELSREAADEGYDVIVSLGGDGTVNEAANGLVGSSTPLTCLPGGATNVLCKMLGIPGDIVGATAHLLRLADAWRPHRIDLARVNGHHFTFSGGVGLDGSVVKRVDERPARKTALRQWYFGWSAVRTFATEFLVDPPQLEISAGDRVLHGVTAIVQNGSPFTYFNDRPLYIADRSRLDNGTLAGAVLHRASPLDLPSFVARLFLGPSMTGHRSVTGFTDLADVRIRSLDGRPVPLEVDGDWLGDVTEADFGITPGGLTVIA
jgi:diacylglycerol kinase family enzyme